MTADYSSSEFAIISTRGTEDLNVDDTLQLISKDNVRLTLRINTMYVALQGSVEESYIIQETFPLTYNNFL